MASRRSDHDGFTSDRPNLLLECQATELKPYPRAKARADEDIDEEYSLERCKMNRDAAYWGHDAGAGVETLGVKEGPTATSTDRCHVATSDAAGLVAGLRSHTHATLQKAQVHGRRPMRSFKKET